jgi:aldose 1-epimerase
MKQTPDKKHTVITLSYSPVNPKEKPLTISVAPDLGSNMFAMRYGNHDIIYHEPDVLAARGFTGNFVLFPTPNRVANSTYAWNHALHRLEKRGKVVLNHGLVFDEPWNYATPVITNTYASVTTSITIDKPSPLFEGYPFPCTVTLTYTLKKTSMTITYTVTNLGKEEMPFGFGLHPYFARLSGNAKTYISAPANSWMESPSDTLLPTGKLIRVNGKPYDIRKPKSVGSLELDHVYTNLTPKQYATVDYRTLGFKVVLKPTSDFTHLVVYTGHDKAVCIENQTCSTDAINLWNKGYKKESHLMTVKPSGKKTGSITYQIL